MNNKITQIGIPYYHIFPLESNHSLTRWYHGIFAILLKETSIIPRNETGFM